jgi:ABC-type Na+ transport system ATPase subunit NatA
MEELAATVDDVVIIKHGTIVADGTLEKQKVTLSRWRTPFCSYCSF